MERMYPNYNGKPRSSRKAGGGDPNLGKEVFTGRLYDVPMDSPSEQLMDMKVQLTLRPRSRSLSRQEKRVESASRPGDRDVGDHGRQRRGKMWSEILQTGDPAKSHRTPSSRRSRSVSPVDDTKTSRRDRKHRRQTSGKPHDDVESVLSEKDHGNTESLLSALLLTNPVQTLQFVLKELRRILKPKEAREEDLFRLAEDLLTKLPQDSPLRKHATTAAQTQTVDSTPHKSTQQISITKFETIRKEKENLEKQLSEKSKSHLGLERRVAALSARLKNVENERDEMVGVVRKMEAENRSLMAALSDKGRPADLTNLQTGLRSALDRMREDEERLESQFRRKFRCVQRIVNDVLDHTKNDSVCVEDALGPPPVLGDLSEVVLPTERRASVGLGQHPEPHAEPTDVGGGGDFQHRIEQYMNNFAPSGAANEDAPSKAHGLNEAVLHNSSIFQSFATDVDFT